jgi:hypothetical protein
LEGRPAVGDNANVFITLTYAAGDYEYAVDLLALEQQGAAKEKPAGQAMMQIGSMATPLVVEEWEAALTTHPDQVYVQFLLRGLRRGCLTATC